MAAADVNGVVSYAGLEKVFADLAAKLTSTGTTLTQAQLTDLQTIAANLNNGMSTSSYLTYITKALVNGNAANAKWTGGAASSTTLGNLAVGSSGAQLTKLNAKWFLGTDLPTSSVTMDGSSFSVSYSVSTKPLFASGGPSMNDINQGYLGDCYLLSGLAEVALQNSSLITSMFTVNGNGTYGVRFYINGQAQYVTVDAELANGGSIFNKGGSDIWASLAEKAYAQLQASGVKTGNSSVNYGNSFSTIGNGGAPECALEEITGATVITDFIANGSSWGKATYNSSLQSTSYTLGYSTATVCSILCADLAQGNDLVLSSYTNATDSTGKTTLVADHAMSIIGFDSMTGNFVIRNPWGSASGQYWQTTFEVSLATLLAAGDTITADNIVHVTPPSLSVNVTVSAMRGQTLTLASLLAITDASNIGYQKLELWDQNGTASGGQFWINGVAQTGGHQIDVTAANLGSVTYKAGTSGGADALWAQLLENDGTQTGWQRIDVSTLDHTPVVSAAAYTATHGQNIAVAGLFSVTDGDGDTVTAYQFWDSTFDASSGHWVVGGVAQAPGQAISVTAAQFTTATFQSGSGSDDLWVQAYDGISWGAWTEFHVNAPVDTGPTLTVANLTASHGQSYAGSALFSNYSDPFGSPATQYDVWNTGTGGGHFVLNGVTLGANQHNIFTAAQLAQLSYQSGSGADTLWIRANDGTVWGSFSSAFTVTAPIDTGPTLTVANVTASHGQSFAGSALFSNYSDPFGSPATQYDLWNAGTGGGHFVLNGTTLGVNQHNVITAAQLAQLSYQSGSGADTLWIKANDGTVWGNWSNAFTVTAPIDLGPTVTVGMLAAAAGQQSIAASSLFSYSDPFGSPATQYDFWDNGVGGGHFALNGNALAAGQDNIISASQLSQVTYQPGNGADTLWIRANDGTTWGAWSHGFQVAA